MKKQAITKQKQEQKERDPGTSSLASYSGSVERSGIHDGITTMVVKVPAMKRLRFV